MKSLIILATAVLCATGASAQKISPGLWEHQVTMKTSDGKMEAAMAKAQAEMAKMPPDQRKMMEEMMAKHGVSVGGAGKPNTMRVCVTPEQAAKEEVPQGDGRCKNEVLSRSAGSIKFKFTCEGPPPTSGEGEYKMTSDKAYSGRTVITSTPKGQAEKMEMTMNGTWISADCGSLAPKK